jgi:hypothetical protein
MTSYAQLNWMLAEARGSDLRREADDARMARIARSMSRPADPKRRSSLRALILAG